MVRTRIAPSPTGEDLHIGNVYTGLINFAFAKKHAGKFIIRIEDTDRQRFVKGSEEKILSSLKLLGLIYNEGPDIGGPFAPYRQSERLKIYHKYAQELLDKGYAEFAYYPKEDAGKKKEYDNQSLDFSAKTEEAPPKNIDEMIQKGDWVIRMKIPKDETIFVNDLIRGAIEFKTSELSAQVLIKSDGYPTYHLGVVVDDFLMEITHVIRAEEWISSTPKHVLLYQMLGFKLPVFAHVPILRNPDHSKLSKRKNPAWISWYFQEGFLPEAILNYLALLGWSHPEEKEIFSLDEFIEKFDLKDVKPVGPVFDVQKLLWVNGEYMRKLSMSDLKSKILSFYGDQFKEVDDKKLDKLIDLAKSRMRTLKDFYLLAKPYIEKTRIEKNEKERDIAKSLELELSSIESWDENTILDALKKVIHIKQCSMKDLYKIITGSSSGLPLPQSLEVIGKEKILSILQ